jgi:hypothetical protein
MSFTMLVASVVLIAPNPGFAAEFHSPQNGAGAIRHSDFWRDAALKTCRNLLDGSDVDSNSVAPDNPHHKRFRIHRNYRQSVTREHFVITFYGSPVSNSVTTADGDLDLLEIIVGLKRSQNADGYELDRIYSVDEEGRIHQHIQPDERKTQQFNDFVRTIIRPNAKP